MKDHELRISDVGEKNLIRKFIKPFFNAEDDPCGVGDDCAMLELGDEIVLFSTDRVPADLTAFRLGILDHYGLGDYLARLNLSDIAACGGRPAGMLLNLGLPPDTPYEHVESICKGFRSQADKTGCSVLGGDITASTELSISATSVGLAKRGKVLRRRGARPGDSIFISRPAGLTPAAFEYLLGKRTEDLSTGQVAQLRRQFTAMDPMIELGQKLANSGVCTSCMDNTDGIGQSLRELGEASSTSFVIEEALVVVPDLVAQVASTRNKDPMQFLVNGGADFSLIGTLEGRWDKKDAKMRFGDSLEIVGHVQEGSGVMLMQSGATCELAFRGWNYFV
jgi:thiamine-monophosphate kinase